MFGFRVTGFGQLLESRPPRGRVFHATFRLVIASSRLKSLSKPTVATCRCGSPGGRGAASHDSWLDRDAFCSHRSQRRVGNSPRQISWENCDQLGSSAPADPRATPRGARPWDGEPPAMRCGLTRFASSRTRRRRRGTGREGRVPNRGASPARRPAFAASHDPIGPVQPGPQVQMLEHGLHAEPVNRGGHCQEVRNAPAGLGHILDRRAEPDVARPIAHQVGSIRGRAAGAGLAPASRGRACRAPGPRNPRARSPAPGCRRRRKGERQTPDAGCRCGGPRPASEWAGPVAGRGALPSRMRCPKVPSCASSIAAA
jgi:hypothetical protein